MHFLWQFLGISVTLFYPKNLACSCCLQDKGIDEAFWPIFQMDEVPEEGKGSHWTVRIGMGAALVLAVWALQAYAPDKGAPAYFAH